jgi:hypothetical protein
MTARALFLTTTVFVVACDSSPEGEPRAFSVTSDDGRATLVVEAPETDAAQIRVAAVTPNVEGAFSDIGYRLEPEDLALSAPAELRVTLPDGVEVPAEGLDLAKLARLAVEGAPPEDGLLHVEAKLEGRELVGRISGLGTFAVTVERTFPTVSELDASYDDCAATWTGTWRLGGTPADARDFLVVERAVVPGEGGPPPGADDPRWSPVGLPSALSERLVLDDAPTPSDGPLTHFLRAKYGTKVGGPHVAKTAQPFPRVVARPCGEPGDPGGDVRLVVQKTEGGSASVRDDATDELVGYCNAGERECSYRLRAGAELTVAGFAHEGGLSVRFEGCDAVELDACRVRLDADRTVNLYFE